MREFLATARPKNCCAWCLIGRIDPSILITARDALQDDRIFQTVGLNYCF